jgi:site-specific DNA-methyltransferase (adenine-specific)
MKPYYSKNGITIYHGDCRDILPHLEQVDLVLTDPPYGVNLSKKTTKARHGFQGSQASVLYQDNPVEIKQLIETTMPELTRIADRMIIFCGATLLMAYPEPRSIGGVYSPAGTGMCNWGFQTFHPILFYGKDPYLADGLGSRPNGFVDQPSHEEQFDHPCPKPLKWMLWAITRGSRDGETILDPFMGSGTTLRAAKDLGRQAIGIEIEEQYCEIAASRLAQEVMAIGGV